MRPSQPMDTDDPLADMSSQADGPARSSLAAPVTEFVPVLCGRERILRPKENRSYRGSRCARDCRAHGLREPAPRRKNSPPSMRWGTRELPRSVAEWGLIAVNVDPTIACFHAPL